MDREELVKAIAWAIIDASGERYPFSVSDAKDAARATLAKIESLGYVVVPREPTLEMIKAGAWADIPGGRIGEPTFRESSVDEDDVPVIYLAMIDCASSGK